MVDKRQIVHLARKRLALDEKHRRLGYVMEGGPNLGRFDIITALDDVAAQGGFDDKYVFDGAEISRLLIVSPESTRRTRQVVADECYFLDGGFDLSIGIELRRSFLYGDCAMQQAANARISDSTVIGEYALSGLGRSVVIDSIIRGANALAGASECIFINCALELGMPSGPFLDDCVFVNCTALTRLAGEYADPTILLNAVDQTQRHFGFHPIVYQSGRVEVYDDVPSRAWRGIDFNDHFLDVRKKLLANIHPELKKTFPELTGARYS